MKLTKAQLLKKMRIQHEGLKMLMRWNWLRRHPKPEWTVPEATMKGSIRG